MHILEQSPQGGVMQIKNLENGMAVGQRVAAELVPASQGVFPTPSQVVLQSLKIRFGKRRLQSVLPIFHGVFHCRFPPMRVTITSSSSFPFSNMHIMPS